MMEFVLKMMNFVSKMMVLMQTDRQPVDLRYTFTPTERPEELSVDEWKGMMSVVFLLK